MSSITQGFKNLISGITSILDYLNPLSDNFILKKLWDFFLILLDLLNPFSENFFLLKLWDFLTSVISIIGSILNYLNPFSKDFFVYKLIELLVEALKSLFNFLFVPSEERITAITNTISAKFNFIESIKISINSLKDIINNLGNAPRLTINVGATKYTDKQNLVAFDLSWYAPYKVYGDLILTGFIYLFFIWRLLLSVPNIINSVGGSINQSNDLMNYTHISFDDWKD